MVCLCSLTFVADVSDLFEDSPRDDLGLLELPPANLGHVDDWVNLLTATDQKTKIKISESIFTQAYVPKVVEMFRMIRDFESKEDLTKMFHVFKGLCMLEPVLSRLMLVVLLNNRGIIEQLVDPDVVLDVAEALECIPTCHTFDNQSDDPNPKVNTKICHSQVLKNQVVFKEVPSIKLTSDASGLSF